MKDIKHIRRDFHSVVWFMPQGSDYGVLCGVWVSLQKSEIQPDLVCELLTYLELPSIFGLHPPGALGRGQKVKYH